MDKVFLKSLGITADDPHIVADELSLKEVELWDQRTMAETNDDEEEVQRIDGILEKLTEEREQVREEAKTYVPPAQDPKEEKKQAAQELNAKKNEALEKLKKRQQEDAAAAQRAVLTSVANTSAQSPAQQPATSNPSPVTAQPAGAGPAAAIPASSSAGTPAQSITQQTSKAVGSGQASIPTAVAQGTGTGEYSTGLRYYQKQDYANALKCFLNVAEKKKVADQKEAQDRTQACYLLAEMYRNGKGVPKADLDRGNHYLRRAADFGYDQAQLEYGKYLLSSHRSTSKDDMEKRAEGLKYVEKAANSGLLDALKEYVEFAANSADADKHVTDKAKAYIPLIRDKVDSYEQKKYDDWLKRINKKEKENRKIASYPIKFIVGELLYLIGLLYLFKGLNPEFCGIFERYIPDIPDILIVKWRQLKELMDPYMTHQGIFGCWLIMIGNMLFSMSVAEVLKRTYAYRYENLQKFLKVMFWIIACLHFVANIVETEYFLGNGGFMQFVAPLVTIFGGRIIGYILKKVIK